MAESDKIILRVIIGEEAWDLGSAPTIGELRDPEVAKVFDLQLLAVKELLTKIHSIQFPSTEDDSSNFADVGNFHEKFGLSYVRPTGSNLAGLRKPAPTGAEDNKELMQFRLDFLHEEMEEFELGLNEGDIAQMADALVDLTYVAMGTAHLLGLPWQDLWDEVQRANITKERAMSDGSNSKRGSSFDVIKPEGWKAPNIDGVLQKYGFELTENTDGLFS